MNTVTFQTIDGAVYAFVSHNGWFQGMARLDVEELQSFSDKSFFLSL